MKDTKVLVEGALTTAIFIVLFLICLFIPPIAIVGALFVPVPIMFYTAKHGVKPGAIVLVASIVLAFLFSNPMSAIGALIFLLVGCAMGFMLFLRKSAFAILGVGSLAAIICIVFYYGLLVTVLHFNPMTEIANSSAEFSKIAEKLSPATTKEQWESYREMLKLLPMLLPMAMVAGGVFYALICGLISAPILRRFGIDFPKYPPFREWSMPKSIIWYYLIVLALLYFGKLDESSSMFMVIFNVFQLLELALMIQGVTFIFFFFHLKGQKLAVPIIISIIGVIIPITLYIIRILGIIDLGMGLRARMRKQ